MANILITGASGFLGRHLAQQLKAQGNNVFGLSRSPRADATLVADAVTPVRGDLLQPDRLASEFAQPLDAVFHAHDDTSQRSEEQTSDLQSLMRISNAGF